MKWIQRSTDKEIELKLLKEGVNRLVARVFSQRKIYSSDFTESSYDKLSNPYTIKGMEEASRFFCDVALKKGTVAPSGLNLSALFGFIIISIITSYDLIWAL